MIPVHHRLARFCKEIDFQYRYLVQRLHFAPTRDQIIFEINYNNNNHPIRSNHGTLTSSFVSAKASIIQETRWDIESVSVCVSILCPTVNQSPGLEINGMLRLCNGPANWIHLGKTVRCVIIISHCVRIFVPCHHNRHEDHPRQSAADPDCSAPRPLVTPRITWPQPRDIRLSGSDVTHR